jgi:hypothetical protein
VRVSGSENENGTIEKYILLGNEMVPQLYPDMIRMEFVKSSIYRIEMPTQSFGGMRAINSARNTISDCETLNIYIWDLPYSSLMQGKLDNASYSCIWYTDLPP